jgi:hypothetical protein
MKLFKTRIERSTEVLTYFVMAEDKTEAIEKMRKDGYPIIEKDLDSIELYEVKDGIDYISETLLPDH